MTAASMRFCALFLLVTVLRVASAEMPTIAFVAGEFEYHSKETLPAFARQLAADYQVKTIVLERPADEKAQTIPGLKRIHEADLLVIMIRRMVLPEEQLNEFKKYLAAGKPLVGLRTASHSFENWRQFDAEVLGGNYQGHHGNTLKTTVSIIPEVRQHVILRGFEGFVSDGSLYRNTPLREGAAPLLLGEVAGKPAEPVAWTHEYKGGRVFYTSLGHPNDFKVESFVTLVRNGIEWTLNRKHETR
jgi:type 1 glutamine amidotransferase